MNRRIDFKAMGCRMTAIVVSGVTKPQDLMQQVPVWFEAWEQVLSRFRVDSELNQLNHSAGWPVQVSQTLWEVFQAAIKAEEASGGLVTPALLEALVAAGYDRSFDGLPAEPIATPVSTWQSASSLAEVTWDETTRTICLPIDMKLDFGGAAKGWAAHQAANRLAGYGPALVSAGGDIAISSAKPDGTLWPVGVENPFIPGETLATLMLGRCGVATSGTDYRRWKQGGHWNHHIIDPRTGIPAQTDVVTATVIAPDAMQAEMAAKVALISGSEQGLEWIESNPQFATLLVLETSEVLMSSRMEQFLWRCA
jgi:thiamine biosynthesis lipoprotein